MLGLDPTTGLNGIKFDDLDLDDDCHRYTITFDTSKLDPRYTLCAGCVDAATKAGNETISGKKPLSPGFTRILGPVCCLIGDCDEETAFGGNSPGGGNPWWFYYDMSSEDDVQKITAGQDIVIGTVSIDHGVVTISLIGGWELQDVAEPVKIQGYDTLHPKRPTAGLFTTYKGGELVVSVDDFNYYVIHLDVQNCK